MVLLTGYSPRNFRSIEFWSSHHAENKGISEQAWIIAVREFRTKTLEFCSVVLVGGVLAMMGCTEQTLHMTDSKCADALEIAETDISFTSVQPDPMIRRVSGVLVPFRDLV